MILLSRKRDNQKKKRQPEEKETTRRKRDNQKKKRQFPKKSSFSIHFQIYYVKN
jgi:hypothetical protein